MLTLQKIYCNMKKKKKKKKENRYHWEKMKSQLSRSMNDFYSEMEKENVFFSCIKQYKEYEWEDFNACSQADRQSWLTADWDSTVLLLPDMSIPIPKVITVQ